MTSTEVSTLENLSYRQFILSFVRHCNYLEKRTECPDIGYIYYKLCTMYSKNLLKDFQRMHETGGAWFSDEICEFLEFLFCGVGSENPAMRNCLKVLFNEATEDFSFNCCIRPKKMVAQQLVKTVLSLCKNLKSVKLQFYDFGEENIFASMPYSESLVKVDLLHSSSNDETVLEILRKCPNIEIIRAKGELIKSTLFYRLCSNYSTYEDLEDVLTCFGQCGNIGKKLRSLILDGFYHNSDYEATACALLHLPSLEEFCDKLHGISSFYSTIPPAIFYLKFNLLGNGEPLKLNLTSLYFGPDRSHTLVPEILECCPNLRSFGLGITPEAAESYTSVSFEVLKKIFLHSELQVRVMSNAFQQYLSVIGQQLQSVSITGEGRNESLDVRCIYSILRHCRNLEEISIRLLKITCSDESEELCNGDYSHNLQKILLSHVYPQNSGAWRFFFELLSASHNLKFLILSFPLAENVLTPAMGRNRFLCLEEISIYFVNLEEVSLNPLIHNNSSLKNIALLNCENAERFVKEHKQVAQERNFPLEIDIIEYGSTKRNLAKAFLDCR